MNWGLKITILYIGFVLLIVTLVTMSMNQKVDLVAPDYYAQELKYQDKIDGMSNYKSLQNPILFSNTSSIVTLTFPAEIVNNKPVGNIVLYRPSDASLDVKLPIHVDTSAKQIISSTKLRRGLYKIRVEWTMSSKQYFTEESLFIN